MLTNISWTDYIIAVAILFAAYYFFVVMRYFFADLKNLISGKNNLKFMVGISYDTVRESNQPSEKNYNGERRAFHTTADDDFPEVEHLIERLKSVIADASGKKLIPQELKKYLHLVLQEYPNIKNSPFRTSINELVASECEKYGVVTLSEDEVELLWKDAH